MSADQDPSGPPLSVALERPDRHDVVVRPCGEVDSASVAEVRAAASGALTPEVTRVVLDLSGVAFMGSAGLALLVEMRDAAVAHGARFALAAVPRAVARPLALTGLADLFVVHPDVDAALATRT